MSSSFTRSALLPDPSEVLFKHLRWLSIKHFVNTAVSSRISGRTHTEGDFLLLAGLPRGDAGLFVVACWSVVVVLLLDVFDRLRELRLDGASSTDAVVVALPTFFFFVSADFGLLFSASSSDAIPTIALVYSSIHPPAGGLKPPIEPASYIISIMHETNMIRAKFPGISVVLLSMGSVFKSNDGGRFVDLETFFFFFYVPVDDEATSVGAN